MIDETTVLDRYIAFTDRRVEGAAELDELRTFFAPNATVHIFDKPITGIDAIIGFYGDFLGRMKESKHYWKTSSIDGSILEADWVAAVRLADGSLVSAGGFERARLNADGLIVDLRNYPNRPDAS